VTKEDRVRRAALLCVHQTRNLAYYRAASSAFPNWRWSEYWRTCVGNLYDTSVLEWCKIFGSAKEKHHWLSLVADRKIFKQRLLAEVKLDETQFEAIRKKMLRYRNTFIAHLDSDNTMILPEMNEAREAIVFFYSDLKQNYVADWIFRGLPDNMTDYFDASFAEAIPIYETASQQGVH